jgi:hypothetical protein
MAMQRCNGSAAMKLKVGLAMGFGTGGDRMAINLSSFGSHRGIFLSQKQQIGYYTTYDFHEVVLENDLCDWGYRVYCSV